MAVISVMACLFSLIIGLMLAESNSKWCIFFFLLFAAFGFAFVMFSATT